MNVMDFSRIEEELVSEIHLTKLQAKIFLLVTTNGKMDAKTISDKLKISVDDSLIICNQLIELGAFIDFSSTEFEAMHPRFTAVNMYRRMCEKNGIEFKRNKIVDNMGVVLERFYDSARTK